MDISRLDLRIGRIVSAEKVQVLSIVVSNTLSLFQHPDADTLYIEKIDVGEDGEASLDVRKPA